MGAKDLLVPVGKFGPLIVRPMGVEGVAVSSDSDWVSKRVGVLWYSGVRLRVVRAGVRVWFWPWVSSSWCCGEGY